jgi:hypothetical protein
MNYGSRIRSGSLPAVDRPFTCRIAIRNLILTPTNRRTSALAQETTEIDLRRSPFLGLFVTALGRWRSTLVLVKPETVAGRHRRGFRLF